MATEPKFTIRPTIERNGYLLDMHLENGSIVLLTPDPLKSKAQCEAFARGYLTAFADIAANDLRATGKISA